MKSEKFRVKKLLFPLTIAAIALMLSACKYGGQSQLGGQNGSTKQGTTSQEVSPAPNGVTVTYTNSGFEPTSVTVSAGSTVTWKNSSSGSVQVGSDDHPTHKLNQEITGGVFTIDIAPGESKTVTVIKTGSWGYHDHLKPTVTGTIVVN